MSSDDWIPNLLGQDRSIVIPGGPRLWVDGIGILNRTLWGERPSNRRYPRRPSRLFVEGKEVAHIERSSGREGLGREAKLLAFQDVGLGPAKHTQGQTQKVPREK